MNTRNNVAFGLLVAGIGALIAAWSFSNPIGAAPDETAHYTKAIGIAAGDWLGERATQAELDRPGHPPGNPRSAFWVRQTRAVHMPVRLRPGPAGCTAFRFVPAAATCLRRSGVYWGKGLLAFTYVGDYAPFVYWPAGVVMLTRATPLSAFIAGRLVFGLIALAFVALGLWMLLSLIPGEPLLLLVGGLVALTPMFIFSASEINPSAIEISAGFATTCAALHLAFSRTRVTAALAIMGLAGAVLALSRALGPLWVVLILATLVALLGRRRAAELILRHRIVAPVTIVALALACAVSVWWQLAFQPVPHETLSTRVSVFLHAFTHVPAVLKQEVGIFGWLDTGQTPFAYLAWAVLILSLIAVALGSASRRERLVLGLWIVGAIFLVPVLAAAITLPGTSVQGRWLLPIATILPLLCAVVIARRERQASSGRALAMSAIVLWALFQFLAIYLNGRRYAVGPHAPLLFFLHTLWEPPLGWIPWIALALAGATACVIAAGGLAAKRAA